MTAPTGRSQKSGTTQALNGVWGSGPNDVFAVGSRNELIVHSSNDGASWQAQHSANTQFFTGVWGSGPDDVFVVGSNGVIVHRNDPEPSLDGDAVFAVLTNNSLWEFGAAGWQHLLSARRHHPVRHERHRWGGPSGRLYAITSDHNLWEHSASFPGNGWHILSAGSFQSAQRRHQPSPARPSSSAC